MSVPPFTLYKSPPAFTERASIFCAVVMVNVAIFYFYYYASEVLIAVVDPHDDVRDAVV